MLGTMSGTLRRLSSLGSADNRKIFAAALIVGALAMAGKLAGMWRELLVAAMFGTGDQVDAYVLAWEVPAYAINVFGSALTAALVPGFVAVRSADGPVAARQLLTGVLVLSLGLLSAMALALALAGPALLGLIASGFGPEKLALTSRLLYVLLPCVVLSGLATLLTGVLTADERFALASASALAVSAASVAFLIGFGQRWGIFALAFGLVAGYALQLAVLARGVRRAGLGPLPGWREQSEAVRQVIRQYAPMVAGMLLISSGGLIDQTMAATLGGGNVAVFSYSSRIVAVVLSVGTMALGTAVLPYFSRMVAERDWAAIQHTLRTYTWLSLGVTVPLTIGLAAFSRSIVRLLFERGAFTAEDTAIVGQVQAMLALQIPFYSLSILYVRLISSLKANRILMYGTAISFALNISLNYVLMGIIGVSGIALSTSFVYVVSLIYLSIMLKRLLRREMAACA
ncbi:MAG: polysaccharide biosynthesis C-terminal domain-containing protein [Thermomicrobiales bacterium]|nr:polysaccharide biosynthesis C-terminal domain-containing protein [Thermomicrobiales bacterium]